MQRWVTARDAWTREDRSIEDHLFDYTSPADPWEPVGTAAEVNGIGLLLIAAGIIALTRAVAPRGRSLLRLTSGAVASVFVLNGLHGIASGALGVPTPLQFPLLQMMLGLVPVIGLGALAAKAFRRSPAVALACACLLGSTTPGLLVATFVVAPAVVGYQSFDTTPWTEAVIAVSTGLAGCAMLAAAGVFELREHGRRVRTAPPG